MRTGRQRPRAGGESSFPHVNKGERTSRSTFETSGLGTTPETPASPRIKADEAKVSARVPRALLSGAAPPPPDLPSLPGAQRLGEQPGVAVGPRAGREAALGRTALRGEAGIRHGRLPRAPNRLTPAWAQGPTRAPIGPGLRGPVPPSPLAGPSPPDHSLGARRPLPHARLTEERTGCRRRRVTGGHLAPGALGGPGRRPVLRRGRPPCCSQVA